MNRIQRTPGTRIGLLWVTVSLITSLAVTGWCDVQGTIVKKNGKGQATGMIKYKSVSKAYTVETKDFTVTISLAEVERVIVKDPPELEPAVKLVQGNQGALAVANLEKIVKDYEGTPPANTAARWLMDAYLKTSQAGKAVDMGNRVIAAGSPIGANPDFCSAYWKALLDANMIPQLKRALDEAIATGPRPLVAQADHEGRNRKETGEFQGRYRGRPGSATCG